MPIQGTGWWPTWHSARLWRWDGACALADPQPSSVASTTQPSGNQASQDRFAPPCGPLLWRGDVASAGLLCVPLSRGHVSRPSVMPRLRTPCFPRAVDLW